MAEKELGYAKLMAGACFLPKANKHKPLGEDAYFICKDEQTIGVADGVGGYANYGIDSGIYARELMKNASEFVSDQSSKGGAVDPKNVLNHAYENSRAKGASTACIITVKDNTLHAVNLGDSGFLVIREDKIVYRSRVQQQHFNCPFQLERLSRRNSPRNAEEIRFEVKHGDVIVAATDGLFDNLYDVIVRDIVKLCSEAGGQPDETALHLGDLARRASFERDWFSPFAKEAMQNGLDRNTYLGGKYDDITVIVGHIIYQSRSSTPPPVPAHSHTTAAAALVSCLMNFILNFIRYLRSWFCRT